MELGLFLLHYPTQGSRVGALSFLSNREYPCGADFNVSENKK